MHHERSMGERISDGAAAAALAVPAVILPGDAHAAQVGCFVTAIFLAMMFGIGIGITLLVKHVLAKYVAGAPKTPWLRLFGITWIELLLVVAVFVAAGTNIWYAFLIYVPFSSLLNMKMLARFSGPASASAPLPRRIGPFLLLSLALPLSLFLSGKIWIVVTNHIAFTNIQL